MSEKKNRLIPEIRFPDFKKDSEWKLKTLGEVGDFVGGGTPDTTKAEYWNGNIQWYTPTEVKEGVLGKSNRTITEEGLNNSSAKLLPKGALLITTRATIGDIGIANSECATNQGFQSLIVNRSEVNTYWYYWIIQHKNELKRKSSGSTFPEIGKNEIIKIRVSRPEKKEQQKIASCLSSLDEVIAAHSQKLELLKKHKKGLMQNLFPQDGEKVPKYRFKEFVKDGNWLRNALGDLGHFLGGGTPDRSNGSYWIGDIPWISSSDLSEDNIHNISVTRFINEIAIKESATKIVPKGSVLFVSRVGVGKLAISKGELCTSQDFTSFVPDHVVLNFFIGYYFSSNKNLLQALNQGTSIKGFSKSDLESLKLPYPKNLKEQRAIASCLSSLDALIIAQAEKIEQLKLQKNGLMQRLFPKVKD